MREVRGAAGGPEVRESGGQALLRGLLRGGVRKEVRDNRFCTPVLYCTPTLVNFLCLSRPFPKGELLRTLNPLVSRLV